MAVLRIPVHKKSYYLVLHIVVGRGLEHRPCLLLQLLFLLVSARLSPKPIMRILPFIEWRTGKTLISMLSYSGIRPHDKKPLPSPVLLNGYNTRHNSRDCCFLLGRRRSSFGFKKRLLLTFQSLQGISQLFLLSMVLVLLSLLPSALHSVVVSTLVNIQHVHPIV